MVSFREGRSVFAKKRNRFKPEGFADLTATATNFLHSLTKWTPLDVSAYARLSHRIGLRRLELEDLYARGGCGLLLVREVRADQTGPPIHLCECSSRYRDGGGRHRQSKVPEVRVVGQPTNGDWVFDEIGEQLQRCAPYDRPGVRPIRVICLAIVRLETRRAQNLDYGINRSWMCSGCTFPLGALMRRTPRSPACISLWL